jgi:hypothetical protein
VISFITGTIGLLTATLIILLIRKDRMHIQHGLGWMVVAIVFALLGFSPGIFDQIAKYSGIAYPPVLALILAITLLVIKILLMDIERSRIEVRNQRLIQRVAMLEADLRQIQKQLTTDDNSPTNR